MSMSYVEGHIRYNNTASLDIPEWYITKIEKEPMMLENIAVACGAVKLTPGAATGMAIGPQVVQPRPAAVVTAQMGTEVHGRIHRPGAMICGWHGIGPARRPWSRM